MLHQKTPVDAGAVESYTEVPPIKVNSTSSPRASSSAANETLTSGAVRKMAIAVDLSDESAYAVKWAVDHYLRPGDAVALLHVRPTSVLYGADWGSESADSDEATQKKKEDDFDAFTNSKAAHLARPLIDAQIPYTIHIVKDRDMKERLCLEIERLGFDAVIMGSRGLGATKKESKGRPLGSVSDYCLQHCICPVVVVRSPDKKHRKSVDKAIVKVGKADDEGVA